MFKEIDFLRRVKFAFAVQFPPNISPTKEDLRQGHASPHVHYVSIQQPAEWLTYPLLEVKE